MLGNKNQQSNPYNEYNHEANHKRQIKSGLDQTNDDQPYRASFDNGDQGAKYKSGENPTSATINPSNHILNNRPTQFRNRASTAAIRKPPLGVIATASARASLGDQLNQDVSAKDVKDEAEVLKIGKRQTISDTMDKDINLVQTNNLFNKGNPAA